MKKSFLRLMAMVLGILSSLGVAYSADTINGAGASFPYPLYAAWASQYNQAAGVQVNYQSIGSGGGQRQIAGRTVDFGASDDPLKSSDLAAKKLLQFPAVIGGVVPVVNIAGMKSGDLNLSPAAICGIFLGRITYWDDQSITAINKGAKLTHEKITVVHRSDGSGTTAIFTKYLADVCPEWESKVGAGKAIEWPVGLGGKGNEGVASYVSKTPGSIGYVEYAYAKQNRIAVTKLQNAAGTFVTPDADSFSDAAGSADFDPKLDFYLWLVNAKGKGAWPIAGATFILLARDKPEVGAKVVKFFDWAYKNGDAQADRLDYVALPAKLKDKVRKYLSDNGIKY